MINKYFSEDYRITKEAEKVIEKTISGAGGGCFPEAALVRTSSGLKRISECVPGTILIAYDRFGIIDYAAVTELHSHTPADYVDDIYFFFSNEISLFPAGVTGNHAIFDSVTGEHKEAKEFKVGENFVDLHGNLIEITSISITTHQDANCAVYNLTVEPQHTFLVGTQDLLIRVHNGGGGKSGEPARAAQEAPNTLQSSSIAKLLEVVSHGEIEGIVGGRKGVFLNGTPLQNSTGEENFENIFFDQRLGTPMQQIIDGFSDIENEVAITPTEIVYGTSGIEHSLPDANVPQIRVTLSLPEGLWKQNKTNGDLNGSEITYAIQTKNDLGGTFSAVLVKTLKGKTVSAYEIAHIIPAPAGATHWSVRVQKLTAPGDSSLRNTLRFERITEIFNGAETYDNIAYAGMRIPAKEVGNSIPTRSYDVMGIKVPIPSNYDPVTRLYTGYWNLAFKPGIHWTDNTAWILLDLIRNAEYGINTFLGQSVKVNLISFYEASLRNDCVTWNGTSNIVSLIADGRGGSEVRYRFNGVIATQQDAWQLLHSVASNMNCLLCIKGGQITLLQDRPQLPVRIINNSNVIDGLFIYSTSEVTNRATAINVTFNDVNDRYLPRTISEPSEETLLTAWYNNAHIKYGYNPKDLVAYGCVTESQARRLALNALYTELNQPEMVSFSMALNICTLQIGDLVSLMDNDKASDTPEFYAGRVITGTANSITLDSPVTLIGGAVYTLGVMSPANAEILEFTVTSASGVRTVLSITPALPAGEYANREFMLFSPGIVEPKEFLIMSIAESAKGKYSFSCLQHDKNKFATIEGGLTVPAPVYSRITAGVVPAVSNILFSPVYMNDGINSKNYINVAWNWSPVTYVEGGVTKSYSDPVTFTLRWRRDNNPYQIENNIATHDFAIPDTTPGVYEVRIQAVNMIGKSSVNVFADYAYRVTTSASTLAPPENFYVHGTTGTGFTGNYIPLSWTFPLANETSEDTLLNYLLEVWTTDGVTKLQSYIVTPDYSRFLTDGVTPNPYYKGGKFNYTLPYNAADHSGVPVRSVQFKLFSRDVIGDISTASVKTFTNAAPSHLSFSYSILFGTGVVYANINNSTEPDVIGYIVQQANDASFVGAVTVYDGPDTLPAIPVEAALGVKFYRIAAYDDFGKTGLDFGSAVSGTTSTAAGASDQYAFSGLVFTPNSPSANKVEWTAGTVSKNNGAPTTINAGQTPSAWMAGTIYIYYPGTGGSALVATTDITLAVAGSIIVATYRGGTDVTVGDGKAFIDGSNLLAHTVGANQVVTAGLITQSAQINGLIVNEGHIQDLAIGSGKIKDKIQSSNWSPALNTGWKLETGNSGAAPSFDIYGTFNVYDTAGALIMAAGGANPGIEWSKIINSEGTGKNLLSNAGFALGLDGWLNQGFGIDRDSNWTIRTPTSQIGVAYVNDDTATYRHLYKRGIPVNAGDWYEISVYEIPYNTSLSIICVFIDAAGNVITSFQVDDVGTRRPGNNISLYTRLYAKGQAPVGAVAANFYFRKNPAISAGSWAFFTMPFFGRATAGQIAPSPWSEGYGGLTQKFSASNITSYFESAAIQRAQIGALNVGTADIVDLNVTTLKLAGNAVIVPVYTVISSSAPLPALAKGQSVNILLATVVIDLSGGTIQSSSTLLLENITPTLTGYGLPVPGATLTQGDLLLYDSTVLLKNFGSSFRSFESVKSLGTGVKTFYLYRTYTNTGTGPATKAATIVTSGNIITIGVKSSV